MSTLIGLVVILLVAASVSLAKSLRSKWEPELSTQKVEGMREPRAPFGLFFDSAHSWVKMLSDGTLRVGIDDFVAEAFGKVDSVEIPESGTKIERGQTLVTLKIGEAKIEIPSPVSGEVATQNDIVEQNPNTMMSDPYGLGWVLSVRPQDHKEAIKPLHVGNGAKGYLRQEVAKLADFFAAKVSNDAMPVMADGGLPQRGAVAKLEENELESFSAEFLKQ